MNLSAYVLITTQGGSFIMEQHKRHSTSKPGARNGSRRIGTAVFVIVSIVLIAGIVALSPLGSYLIDQVIRPVFAEWNNKDDKNIVSALKQQEQQEIQSPSPVPTVKSHETVVMDEMPFYILQMGAFTDKEAAAAHADEIRRMGAGGAVFQDGSVYRVFAAAYTDETSLAKVQSQVRSDGFEATPYITESKAISITLDGDHAAVDVITKAAKLLNAIPSDLCAMCLAFDKGDLRQDELTASLQKQRDTCTGILKEMEKINMTDVMLIKELLQKYVKNISTFLNEHGTMNTEMISGELKCLQLSVIIDYILFYDQR